MAVTNLRQQDLSLIHIYGSNALYYEKSKIQDDYKEMAEYILKNLHGKTFPGWEPERMAKLDELFEAYRPVTKEKLWENLQYFLEAIMPTCHETGIKVAIHQMCISDSGRCGFLLDSPGKRRI